MKIELACAIFGVSFALVSCGENGLRMGWTLADVPGANGSPAKATIAAGDRVQASAAPLPPPETPVPVTPPPKKGPVPVPKSDTGPGGKVPDPGQRIPGPVPVPAPVPVPGPVPGPVPVPGTPIPGSGPGSEPGTGPGPEHGHRQPEPDHRSPDPGHRTPDPDHRTPDPDHRTPDPGAPDQRRRTQDPGPQCPNERHDQAPSRPESVFLGEVLQLANAYRVQNGLKPVTLHRDLSTAAQRYAERMAQEGFFDHQSPAGDPFGDRIGWSGYVWRTCGENIAMGQLSAQEVMAGWIKSESHRANLLNAAYTEMGLGYAEGVLNPQGKWPYWVQEFATPR